MARKLLSKDPQSGSLARCELIRVEGGGHGFAAWDKDPAMAGYRQQMLDWLKRVLR